MWVEKEQELNEENLQLNIILEKLKVEMELQQNERDNHKNDEDKIRGEIREKVITL